MSFLYLIALSMSFAQCLHTSPPKPTITSISPSDIDIIRYQYSGCYTILELWASWCGSCKKSKPKLMEIINRYPEVKHLSFSADYNPQPIRKYLTQEQYLPQRVYLIQKWSVENLEGVFSLFGGEFRGAIPFVMLFGPDGEVLYQSTEAKEYSKLNSILEKALVKD